MNYPVMGNRTRRPQLAAPIYLHSLLSHRELISLLNSSVGPMPFFPWAFTIGIALALMRADSCLILFT